MHSNLNIEDFVGKPVEGLQAQMATRMNMFINGGATKRFHTVRTLNENTVAAHSFGVAHFVWLLSDGKASAAAIMAALSHDLAEQHVGDIPSPAKRALNIREDYWIIENELLKSCGYDFEHKLIDEELLWLKLADLFDGMAYCVVERAMGNQDVTKAFRNFREYTHSLIKSDRELTIYQILVSMWQAAQRGEVE